MVKGEALLLEVMNNTTSSGGSDPEEGISPKIMTVSIMLSIFSVVGVVGNATAFYIFFRRRNTSTSVVFILTLAGIDFITCMVTIPYTIVFELLGNNLVFDLACKIYMFLITSTLPFSAFVMVGIALDRYFCICHPFLFVMTLPRAKAVVLCLTIPAIALGFITSLNYGIYSLVDRPFSNKNISQDLNITNISFSDDKYLQMMNENRPFENREDIEGMYLTPDKQMLVVRYYMRQNTCVANNIFFSVNFLHVYRHVHASCFLVSYIIVAILYILIYKSIYTRRANKAKRKRKNTCPVEGNRVECPRTEETQMTSINGVKGSPSLMNNQQTRKSLTSARKITPARNDLGPRNTRGSLGQDNGCGDEGQEDETTNLLPQTVGDTKPADSRPVLCDKVYDGHDSDEETVDTKPPSNPANEPKSQARDPPGDDVDDEDNQTRIEAVEDEADDDEADEGEADEDDSPTDKVDADYKTGHLPDRDTSKTPLLLGSPQDNGTGADACTEPTNTNSQPPTPPPGFGGVTSSLTPPTSLPIKTTFNAPLSPQDPKGKPKHLPTDSQTNSIKRKRPSTVRDRNFMANIKTAFMLFIVTIVFIVAFCPALLMANSMISMNLIGFYSYFIYNVANPFIYAFMNQTFREDLKKIINPNRP